MEGWETPILICLCTAQKWLYKLGYEYKNVPKYVVINGHEQPNIIEDYKVFLNKIKELKPYIVKFNNNSTIKPKLYPPNCVVGSNNWQLIIIITYNKYIFFANDSI